jgi:dienelactone hydrolase
MTLAAKFTYDHTAPLEIREVSSRAKDGVTVRDFTYRNPFGVRRAAYYVRPEEGGGPFPAILYLHWYEPEAPDSNRTQFLDEAREMARHGCAALLVETMWSDRDWFIKREQAEDLQSSIHQVVELRQALDLLLAQPGIDAGRLALVGHDFGAMYGVVSGAADPRPRCYVLMAGTPRFPDWFMYYPKLEGDARRAFMESFIEIDPITLAPLLSPAPVLLQFGEDDPHVPRERSEQFYQAAKDPKEIRWYAAGHGLNEAAARDRLAWLAAQLGL